MASERPNLSDDYENRATHEATRERAESVIWDFLVQADAWASRKQASWDDGEKLMNLESTAEAAAEMGVHMGEAFRAREDFSTRFHRMVFGSATSPLLSAELEEEGDTKKAKIAAALVEEAWRNDMRFEQKGLEWTREVGCYGSLYFKALPSFEKKRTFTREVKQRINQLTGQPTDGFNFGKKTWVTAEHFRIQNTAINPRFFRYAPGADDIESAHCCGDWQTIRADEFDKSVEDGIYAGPGVEKAAQEMLKQIKGRERGSTANRPAMASGLTYASDYAQVLNATLKKPQMSAAVAQLCVFEWHGLFDLNDDGDLRMTMIVAAFPSDLLGHIHQKRTNSKMWVLSVGASPFAHQRKPYFFWPCIKRSGDLDGMSVVDIVRKHSDYADEFYSLGLLGAHMEVNPPLIVEDPDIPDEALTGFIPGKKIRGRRDGIGFLDMPNKSGQAFRLAEFLQMKDRENVGIGGVSTQPRVAAAGILEQAGTEDLRMLAYINPFEQYCLLPGSQLVHSYMRQYMTTSRAVRAIGIDGVYARTRSTITPEDLAFDIRFEPSIGRHLSQKPFQSQGLVNTLDRALVINQQAQAVGLPAPCNVPEMLRSIYADGYGMQDPERFVYSDLDPETIRTAHEEHELYALGQRPGVQRGENKLQHALQHLKYWAVDGSPELLRAEDRLAFFDHLLKTIEAVMRGIESATPDIKALIQAQFQAIVGQQGSRPGFMPQGEGQPGGGGPGAPGGQPGGRGVASGASLTPGSPLIRPDRPSGMQGVSMGKTANLGAA